MRRNFPFDVCEFAGTAFMLFWGVTAVALIAQRLREASGRIAGGA